MPEIISQTAIEVAGAAGTPYDQALALQSYLRAAPFAYSEDAPVADGFDGSGLDALAVFLQEKVGYCVHYASAMAVMARTLGIPSRIAVGFQPGDLQLVDGRSVYTVSSDDLHAWPELYFDGVGWLRFEPTPGRGSVPDYGTLLVDDPNTPEDESNPTPVATSTAAPGERPDLQDVEAGAVGTEQDDEPRAGDRARHPRGRRAAARRACRVPDRGAAPSHPSHPPRPRPGRRGLGGAARHRARLRLVGARIGDAARLRGPADAGARRRRRGARTAAGQRRGVGLRPPGCRGRLGRGAHRACGGRSPARRAGAPGSRCCVLPPSLLARWRPSARVATASRGRPVSGLRVHCAATPNTSPISSGVSVASVGPGRGDAPVRQHHHRVRVRGGDAQVVDAPR